MTFSISKGEGEYLLVATDGNETRKVWLREPFTAYHAQDVIKAWLHTICDIPTIGGNDDLGFYIRVCQGDTRRSVYISEDIERLVADIEGGIWNKTLGFLHLSNDSSTSLSLPKPEVVDKDLETESLLLEIIELKCKTTVLEQNITSLKNKIGELNNIIVVLKSENAGLRHKLSKVSDIIGDKL